jgi:hypothetical protein
MTLTIYEPAPDCVFMWIFGSLLVHSVCVISFVRSHDKEVVKNYEESMNSTATSFKHSLQVHSKAMNVHFKQL